MSDSSSSSMPLRRRGGQPGNKNAFRHGFYIISKKVLSRMDADMNGDISDEIIALRSLTDTTLNTFAEIEHPTLDQCLSTLHGISQGFDTMRALYLAQKYLYHNQTTIDQVLDELEQIPVEDD
jgi:hypothetical protein